MFDNVKVRGLFREEEVKESSREGQWTKHYYLPPYTEGEARQTFKY